MRRFFASLRALGLSVVSGTEIWLVAPEPKVAKDAGVVCWRFGEFFGVRHGAGILLATVRRRSSPVLPMSKQIWRRIAGLSGASSIGLAAYGAHGLKCDQKLRTTFENGVRLHMTHSVMLALCPLLPRPALSGALFTAGIIGFSGSCYAAVFTNDRANGKYAPYGGSLLIAGWLTLVL